MGKWITMVHMGIKITVLDTLDGRGKKYSQAFLYNGCTCQIAQYITELTYLR